MNTADLSVLPDEFSVTLTPLRRGAQRARAVCAKLVGMATPWGAATGPARWPFPPVPVEDGALTGPGEAQAPQAVPVPRAVPAARERSLGNATVEPVSTQVTTKQMVMDVLLVLMWGAMIPALMWLGAAAGF